MEQNVELVVERHCVLTGLVHLFVLVETLVQIRLAFRMSEFLCGFVFLPNGRIGFSLQLMQQGEEVLKLVEIVTHSQGFFTSGVIACHQAHTAIGGHAEAVKEVSVQRSKMRSPSLGG